MNRFVLKPYTRHNEKVRIAGIITILLIPFGLMGCSRSQEYFPLEMDRSWTYDVRSGLATFVVDVKVTKKVPVGSSYGYQLEGPLGMTRLAWSGNRLISDNLPNTRIGPPITLLAPGETKPILWQGFIETMGKSNSAKATLTQKVEKLQHGSRKYDTIKATLEIKTDDRKIELITWYAPDMGPLRQEQRTNDVLDVAMKYLGVAKMSQAGGWSQEIQAMLRKEWRGEMRSKAGIYASGLFSTVTVIAIWFAAYGQTLQGTLAAGLLWIALVFASVLALPRSFVIEEEQGTGDLLRLWARPHSVFWARHFSIWARWWRPESF